jgi:D-serine deaminase-like pyridoxal phosphate-dependent protein
MMLKDVDTPALVVDLDVMERNIWRMMAFLAPHGTNLRPHVKTHKTPEIAQKQIAAGAIGVTCAKVGEAEAMVDGGIRHILIANQIVTPSKIARLVQLARRADMIVAVDEAANVRALSEAASAAGVTLGILVEVEIGMDRCGVAPGAPGAALATTITQAPGLAFRGIMGYEGHLVMAEDPRQKEVDCRRALDLLVATRDAIVGAGLPVEIVSAGGTGTYAITGTHPGITEIQAGSYVVMDAAYRRLGIDFEVAMWVQTTAVSRPRPARLVTDAGTKAVSCEFGPVDVVGLPGAAVVEMHEEHAVLSVPQEARYGAGDVLGLVPSHCCGTFCQHDKVVAVRGDSVEAVWSITGRGRFQ